MAVVLRRAELLSKGLVVALGIVALVAFLPLPMTTFVFVTVLAIAARNLQDVAAAPARSAVSSPRVAGSVG